MLDDQVLLLRRCLAAEALSIYVNVPCIPNLIAII